MVYQAEVRGSSPQPSTPIAASSIRTRESTLPVLVAVAGRLLIASSIALCMLITAPAVASAASITTTASPNTTVGGQLTDQATVSNLLTPVPGASVTFRLFAPSDPDCAGVPIFVNTKAVTLTGTTATATSDAYTPTNAGDHRWIATYDGDLHNPPISGTCSDPGETSTVLPTPAACTRPPGPAPQGGELCPRGTAAIRGRTGCQSALFSVVVSGRQIARVVFSLDGKRLRTLTTPNSGSRYALRVNPRTLPRGIHRVIARVTFRKQSATGDRTLRVTFSRCAAR